MNEVVPDAKSDILKTAMSLAVVLRIWMRRPAAVTRAHRGHHQTDREPIGEPVGRIEQQAVRTDLAPVLALAVPMGNYLSAWGIT